MADKEEALYERPEEITNKERYVFNSKYCKICPNQNEICIGTKCKFRYTCKRCLRSLPECRGNYLKLVRNSDSILPCFGCEICNRREKKLNETGIWTHCFICANRRHPTTFKKPKAHCEVHCLLRFDPVYDLATPRKFWPSGKLPNQCGFCLKGHHTSVCVDRPIHVLLNKIRNPKKKAEE